MRRPVNKLLAAIVLAAIVAAGFSSGAVERADAASFHDLGDDDVLVWLTPWETKYLYSVLNNPGKVDCLVPVLPDLVSKTAGKLHKICKGLKFWSDWKFWQVKSALYFATLNNGCGAFVIDDAGWRSWTNYRPAKNDDTKLNHTYTALGRTTTIEGITRLCDEWANPPVESNIIQPGPTLKPLILGAGA